MFIRPTEPKVLCCWNMQEKLYAKPGFLTTGPHSTYGGTPFIFIIFSISNSHQSRKFTEKLCRNKDRSEEHNKLIDNKYIYIYMYIKDKQIKTNLFVAPHGLFANKYCTYFFN